MLGLDKFKSQSYCIKRAISMNEEVLSAPGEKLVPPCRTRIAPILLSPSSRQDLSLSRNVQQLRVANSRIECESNTTGYSICIGNLHYSHTRAIDTAFTIEVSAARMPSKAMVCQYNLWLLLQSLSKKVWLCNVVTNGALFLWCPSLPQTRKKCFSVAGYVWPLSEGLPCAACQPRTHSAYKTTLRRGRPWGSSRRTSIRAGCQDWFGASVCQNFNARL